MTVNQLNANLTNEEFIGWLAFYEIEHEAIKKQQERDTGDGEPVFSWD
jgi:hypothetical protein